MNSVISSKTGMRFDVSEFVPMNEDTYINMFSEHVPSKPFMDPVVDPLAIFLFHNAGLFQRILHHIKKYGCIDPIFVDENKLYPTTFSYLKEFIKFRDNYLEEKHRDGFIDNWQKNVSIAIAKLSGHMYMSAGAD